MIRLRRQLTNIIMSSEPYHKRPRRTRARRRRQLVGRIGIFFFVLYIAVLTYFLFFADWYGRNPYQSADYQYNIIPFVEIRRFLRYREILGAKAVFLNLFGNVLGFIPFGFFCPIMSDRLRNGLLVTFLGFAMSFAVEVIQLLTRLGRFDVDDLILNTIGAAVGYLLYCLTRRLGRRWHG